MKEDIKMLKEAAVNALAEVMAHAIRHDHGDDPDHSGPEDCAEIMAEALVDFACDDACHWREAYNGDIPRFYEGMPFSVAAARWEAEKTRPHDWDGLVCRKCNALYDQPTTATWCIR